MVFTRAATRPDMKIEQGRDSGVQNRVDRTVELAYDVLTDEKIPTRLIKNTVSGTEREVPAVRMSKLLSQSILAGGDEQKFIAEYKEIVAQLAEEGITDLVEQQNTGVLRYLEGKMKSGNALQDIKGTAELFSRSLQKLYVPFAKKTLQEGGDTTVTFAAVRHGEKAKEGTLTPHGEQEAQEAGKLMKSLENLQGIVGVQQPHNQMMMLALMAGKTGNKSPEQVWESLPDARKTPYKTGEVTEWSIGTAEGISGENLDDVSTTITITRNNHSETFSLADLKTYIDMPLGEMLNLQ